MTVAVSTDMRAAKLVKDLQKFRREFRVKITVAVRGIKELDLGSEQASVLMLGVASGALAAITDNIYLAHQWGVLSYSSVQEALLKTAALMRQGEHVITNLGQDQWGKDLAKLDEAAQKALVASCKKTADWFEVETKKALEEYWQKKNAEEAEAAQTAGKTDNVLKGPFSKDDTNG